MKRGFTLIELSIVLVIIGLIVGGILVGQDMIKAAQTRAQISQIEKLNTATNTFRGKYNALPGDMAATTATQYGFPPFDVGPNNRLGTQGRGDGNGVLDSFTTGIISNPSYSLSGEVSMFWGDLTFANMVEGNFSADQHDGNVAASDITGSAIATYLPPAKIGNGNYITVYAVNGTNYFNLMAINTITFAGNESYASTANIPVTQAYNMDKKMDDGIPTTGTVLATYLSGSSLNPAPNGPADSTTTCYNAATNTYSMSSLANYGGSGNCALSFRFQ